METSPEIERDTIAWFNVGLVVTSALVGSAFFVSGARPAAYFFLGYAIFCAAAMFVFKSWRSSSEVEKVQKSHFKRMVRNIPRAIFRFFLGFVAFIIVIGIGLIPAYLFSNEFYHKYEQFWTAYSIFLVGVSFGILLWVGGFIKLLRQAFLDFKDIRAAAESAKKRRAKEKRRLKVFKLATI